MEQGDKLVGLGSALRHFFNHGHVNIYHGEITINLLDNFPIMKQGHAYYQTIKRMMNIYVEINNLGDHLGTFSSDLVFRSAFDGECPILQFPPQIGSVHSQHVIMKGVNEGLINKNMNTFQIIRALVIKFDSQNLRKSDIDVIIRNNSISNNSIDNPDVTSKLTTETIYSQELEDIINDILHHINPTSETVYEDTSGWDLLLEHTEVSPILIPPIKFINLMQLRKYNIITQIKYQIIKKDWYLKQVFESQLHNIIGEATTIPIDIYRNYLNRRF